ncbi:ATP:cob(I)alamin adenosyltransferase [Candidatus Woesearchaeota archaeon CG10_big_fil_rev_8_21_14_0_10_32_24]|nr:MAG: ATP:cob(I)alamin adenosyltransferase [Candidatus Woesearchaeota archaeon CG10_big_fil_rev_8_21_14_0_10_32_24]
MKIYTKTGDQGKTSFYGGTRVPKDDLRIEVLGSIDELNSMIGVTLCFVENEKLRGLLSKIQHDLFTVGADMASSHLPHYDIPKIQQQHIKDIEEQIDNITGVLTPQTSFIIPGGTVASSFLHLCCSITRRTERVLVKASTNHLLNSSVLSYVNRLSDLFYVLARHANNELEVKEQQPIYKYFNGVEKHE